jgi:hypothetical protein
MPHYVSPPGSDIRETKIEEELFGRLCPLLIELKGIKMPFLLYRLRNRAR